MIPNREIRNSNIEIRNKFEYSNNQNPKPIPPEDFCSGWRFWIGLLTALAAFATGGIGWTQVVASLEMRAAAALVPDDAWIGEPYALAGKRVVFTNWHFIRPGSWNFEGKNSWIDNRGEEVVKGGSPTGEITLGPWGGSWQDAHDAPRGIRLVGQKPARMGEPIIQSERPWESMGVLVYNILKDGDLFKAWGHCQDESGKGWGGFKFYMESHDGIHWERPELDMVEYNGSTANNLLPDLPDVVFIDPKAPAAERYKSIMFERTNISVDEFAKFIEEHPDRWEHNAVRVEDDKISCVYGWVSPDGLNWKRLDEPFTVEHSERGVATYNRQTEKYAIYSRKWYAGERAADAPDESLIMKGQRWKVSGRRSIGYTESDTFGDFPLSRLLIKPRLDWPPHDVIYNAIYTTIPGAPDHHLMFPAVWNTSEDTTRLEMVTSHDGRVWDWVPGGPFMDTAAFGEWDGGCIFWRPDLLELGNGDFALPYNGFSYPHKYPRGDWSYAVGYAVWPKGRIMALEAPDDGEFTMMGVMAPGRKLRINAVTKRAGWIKVAVSDLDGSFLEGRSFEDATPIVGDRFWTPVTWNGQEDLGFEEGQPICLRFKMKKAQIFGLEFE